MGLLDLLRRIFFPAHTASPSVTNRHAIPARRDRRVRRRHPHVKLVPLRYRGGGGKNQTVSPEVDGPEPPYRFANYGVQHGAFLDLSRDGDENRLAQFGLPSFHTPEALAQWLGLSVGKVAWLIHRFSLRKRAEDERQSHYHCRWLAKRRGGHRLLETPKPTLMQVQRQILAEIINRIPVHPAVHGFVPNRSIISNARPHVGQRVILKFDLENFYASVTFARVVAIFRSVGYSREAAIWLGRLLTTRAPWNMNLPAEGTAAILPYLAPHLPQGAPASPALANLAAYSLDVRLSGLARSFGAEYTRYADDLTFSGDEQFLRSLRVFIPLATKITRSERFRCNRAKRRVIRDNQRQSVTGVVVNQKCNISRADYDRLKAMLTNCVRLGWRSQNRKQHENFAAYLRGKIAHVQQLNPRRGEKLLALYRQINW